uniref:Uncharacterized protein n=1 Tax=Strigamia maritima TaxID=126957 RepID=T1JEY0_STRMM
MANLTRVPDKANLLSMPDKTVIRKYYRFRSLMKGQAEENTDFRYKYGLPITHCIPRDESRSPVFFGPVCSSQDPDNQIASVRHIIDLKSTSAPQSLSFVGLLNGDMMATRCPYKHQFERKFKILYETSNRKEKKELNLKKKLSCSVDDGAPSSVSFAIDYLLVIV